MCILLLGLLFSCQGLCLPRLRGHLHQRIMVIREMIMRTWWYPRNGTHLYHCNWKLLVFCLVSIFATKVRLLGSS